MCARTYAGSGAAAAQCRRECCCVPPKVHASGSALGNGERLLVDLEAIFQSHGVARWRMIHVGGQHSACGLLCGACPQALHALPPKMHSIASVAHGTQTLLLTSLSWLV
jgi:hypothetical protein